MFSSQILPRLNVRLPAALKDWVAQEAADRKCPMNTVVLHALSMMRDHALSEQRGQEA